MEGVWGTIVVAVVTSGLVSAVVSILLQHALGKRMEAYRLLLNKRVEAAIVLNEKYMSARSLIFELISPAGRPEDDDVKRRYSECAKANIDFWNLWVDTRLYFPAVTAGKLETIFKELRTIGVQAEVTCSQLWPTHVGSMHAEFAKIRERLDAHKTNYTSKVERLLRKSMSQK